jgi:hypothetical protein
MSDTIRIILLVVALFGLATGGFIIGRVWKKGKPYDEMSDEWQRDQQRKVADEDTKAWPLPPAAV